jgi:hypothetical protein
MAKLYARELSLEVEKEKCVKTVTKNIWSGEK